MGLAAKFDMNTDTFSKGNISVSYKTNKFTVGSRSIEVTPHEVAIIGRLIHICDTIPSGFDVEEMTRSLRYQTEEAFETAFTDLMTKLGSFNIANDGGTGTIYYESAVTGADLFKVKDGKYSFNKDLAMLIGDNPELSEEQLKSVGFKPAVS